MKEKEQKTKKFILERERAAQEGEAQIEGVKEI